MPDNSFQNLTDEELINLDSAEAQAELLKRYFRLVRFHAGRYATTPADIEDLTQEGLITLLYVTKKFDASLGSRFSSFAQICIINRMRSLMRQERHIAEPTEDLIDKLEAMGELTDPDTPESILMAKESFADFRTKIMTLLSKKEWEILQCILNGHSYAHTAELLSITVKSVDNAMQRIRRKIRAQDLS